MAIIRKEFRAKETICESCCEVIRMAAMKVDGVTEASFSYPNEKGYVVFDDSKATIEQIFKKIEEKGYPCTLLDSAPVAVATENMPEAAGKKPKKPKKGKACEPDCNCSSEEEPAESPSAEPEPQVAESGAESGTGDAAKEAVDDKADDIDDEDDVIEADEAKTKRPGQNKMFALGMMALGMLVLGYFLLPAIGGFEIPQFSSTMGYSLLFVAGLLTGFHCISMCGSFVVSYTAKDAQAGVRSKKSHLMYGFGKTVSYTAIGAIFGLVGSVVAFTPAMRGAAAIIAGMFLLLYGLKMLNVHPIFRKLTLRTPKFIARFVHKEEKQHSNPLLIGLLNGLMIACGPLQAMYIMAAGTGSMIEGAKLLLIFGLGALPPMLGFGYFASALSSKMTHKILKLSGVVVIILGIFMFNNGLALTGSGYDFGSIVASGVSAAVIGDSPGSASNITAQGFQEIRMDVLSSGWSPNTFVLKKGVPVKWIINGKELNGCNSGIQVPKLNLKFQVKQGEQTIEFTPTEEGTIPFSCWMGMIQGRFIVKANVDVSNSTAVQQEIAKAPPVQSGGSCGCGGGGSTGSCHG
jgi:sulfite exporter TauE/SafE/copper chaperone CopZ